MHHLKASARNPRIEFLCSVSAQIMPPYFSDFRLVRFLQEVLAELSLGEAWSPGGAVLCRLDDFHSWENGHLSVQGPRGGISRATSVHHC